MTTTTSGPSRANLETADDPSTWSRIAGVCGIVAAVLWFVMGVAVAADSPVIGDPADELRTWLEDQQDSIPLFTLGMGLVLALLLVFGTGLRSRLARVDRSGHLSDLFYAGLVAQLAGAAVGLTFWATASHDAVIGLSDDVIVTLLALDTIFFFAILPWSMVVMLLAASIVIVRSRTMPVWVGGLGIVCAVATAISTLWLIDGDADSFLAAGPGFIGFVGTLLWFAVVGGHLVRGDTA